MHKKPITIYVLAVRKSARYHAVIVHKETRAQTALCKITSKRWNNKLGKEVTCKVCLDMIKGAIL